MGLLNLSLLTSTLHALTTCTLKGNASLHSYLGFGYDIPIKLCFVHASTALFLSAKFILNPKLSLSQSYSIAGNLTMPSMACDMTRII